MAQRVGPVHVDDNDADDDLTIIEVPSECVGFVTGKQGNFLRTMEDEWGVIMFFAEFKGTHAGPPPTPSRMNAPQQAQRLLGLLKLIPQSSLLTASLWDESFLTAQ
jgi:hypothetical protein